MTDRKKVENIFAKIRKSTTPSYYATIVNVSNAFTTWLNDGDKAKGFKLIKNISKKKQKRGLKASSMWTWDDGQAAIQKTNSVQIKAIIMTQLEAGFRPSELIDLNYGDVRLKENFAVLSVADGKTGARNVIVYKSVPFLLAWLQNHPTKNDDGPLWVIEDSGKSHKKKGKTGERYEYPALLKRLKQLATRAGINKPTDFYTLRHSACTMAKKENVPPDLAAKNFGHSVKYFTEVYGRLTSDDDVERYSKVYGVAEEEIKTPQTISCERCKFVNRPELERCSQCSAPLTQHAAMKEFEEVQRLKKQVEELAQMSRIKSKVVNQSLNKGKIIDKELVKEVLHDMLKKGEISF